MTSSKASFASTIREIEAQERDIPEYISYIKSLHLENLNPREAIFSGAGDSLACSKFVERLMNFEPRAYDPYDVILNSRVAQDKKVYFISVSGRTKANIQAAKLIKRHAKETFAVTANPKSELAKTCSNTIELRFTKVPGLTPGTNSFTISLLACSMLFKNPPKIDVKLMVERAREWAKSVQVSKGTIHFIGSGSFYALAMYGAAKIYEFAGAASDYQLTEEFSHMNLFATRKQDTVMILSYGKEDEKANTLCTSLTKAGIKSMLLPTLGDSEHVLQRAIFQTICLQYLALKVARNRGVKQPAFLHNKTLLEISDKMIY